ncbi:GNAT family N-acetyltransferase [Paenibacillus profundus]|uniref:GNAT family N-acetyltransferase n=1 Tax=Paenibacillus profundus TaxID=1173085 RepID=A0ABS8YCC4_9BACL|nr:GNAT family N-acetyltransferase [Paenibacillus profundus]MCE5168869.1 GNAT family N-acetyltransferase [Paenibacillus profundus]
MQLKIVPLNESLIPKVRGLVSGYLNSSSNGGAFSSEQMEECEQILNRFLCFNLAHCYLAKHGEDYVGLIVLSWSFSLSKGYAVLRIEALYSSPKYRNKGVGRRLLQHAIDLANERKATRLQLETDDDNAPARALYTNLGFELLTGKGVYMLFL